MPLRRQTRLLLYCHNTVGLGHISRTVQIAAAAADREDCECRIITGCRFLHRLRLDPRVPIEELPPARVVEGFRLTSVDGEQGEDVMELRGRRIEQFTRSWSPDVFLADHAPLGLGGELVPTLTSARREGWPTRFVWGLRDIRTDPQHAVRTIRKPGNPAVREALGVYCGALAYSDKEWIDPFEVYKNWFLPERCEYVGVVARRPFPTVRPPVPTVVTLAGGGTRGAQLFQMVLKAASPLLESDDLKLRFVVGPFGSMDRLSVPEKLRDRVELLADCSTEEAIRDASLVVSRVGYNTAYTVIQTDVPIVFVPLPAPGQEQGYRARMLARLPDVSVIEEERPRAEEDLRVAIQRGLGSSPVVRELPFRIDGARGAADLLMEIADVKEKAVEASYC